MSQISTAGTDVPPVLPPPGRPFPLGATVVDDGVNLAVWSPGASLVEACLFAVDGSETRIPLHPRHDGIHHALLRGVQPGACYGLRAHGPWDPGAGYRFNPAKLLMDPYARAIEGDLVYDDALTVHLAKDVGSPDPRDTAAFTPRSVIVATQASGEPHRRPNTPWHRTVIYEMHVKGFTALHPSIPAEIRGTYAGLAHPAAIEHLLALGVTAVELMPVHHFVTEPVVAARGLQNYWGYNTLGFFAPHAAYASTGTGGEQVAEFKAMVRALHDAGLEVILDVVYNHTCESGHGGPTLSFRGLGDGDHYKLIDHGTTYYDSTGCGNTVDAGNLGVLRLITDSLRYWVTEMGVDGFRFDLASSLTREDLDCDLRSPFLAALHQDPVLREVKLIAEPWDLGGGGYLVGTFGPPWSEWNDKYRSAVRDFWRGSPGDIKPPSEMGWRLTGSQDLYWNRSPRASVNFVTAHDGFPMRDLTEYNSKHNEANRENNRDGSNDNRSWNHGIEGPTDDVAIIQARGRTVRGMLATLLLSTGTPMILMGDELGHTQGGNNNAYCHDDPTTWINWVLDDRGHAQLEWTKALIALRQGHPTLRQGQFFEGRPVDQGRSADLSWLLPDGSPMTDAAWNDGHNQTLLMALSGDLGEVDYDGKPLRDSAFLLVLHAAESDTEILLPTTVDGTIYARVLDTAQERPAPYVEKHPAGIKTGISGRSVVVFRVE
jgi:isoamylase